MIASIRHFVVSFGNARKGAVAVLAAVMLVPLIAAAGAAVDFSRESALKASLQTIVDDAALAGASNLNQSTSTSGAITLATNYFNTAVAVIANTATISTPTVTVPNSITVTVSATASMKTTLMGLFLSVMPVAVTATAQGPGYAIKATKTGGFSSSAYDGNSIYFYTVPSNGGYPPSPPDGTAKTFPGYTLMFTNSTTIDPAWATDNLNPKAIAVSPNDQVGFVLVNTTGGNTGYAGNSYGSTNGQTHDFFSSLPAPSQDPTYGYPTQSPYYTGTGLTFFGNSYCFKAPITSTNGTFATSSATNYPTDPTSCVTHPCVTKTSAGLMNNNLLINGACSTQSSAVQTCLQLYNNPISFRWNDMGGNPDDYDYNDADYTISCTPNTTGTSVTGNPKAVILTN